MTVEIKVPDLPESVADATVGDWHKAVGETIKAGELLVDIETDKIVLEVPAPEDGVVAEILAERGTTVHAKALLGRLTPLPQAGELTPQVVEPAAEPVHDKSDVLTPSVRRLLSEAGVSADEIPGRARAGGSPGKTFNSICRRAPSRHRRRMTTTPSPSRASPCFGKSGGCP